MKKTIIIILLILVGFICSAQNQSYSQTSQQMASNFGGFQTHTDYEGKTTIGRK